MMEWNNPAMISVLDQAAIAITAKESLMDSDLEYQEYDAFVKQLETTYPRMFAGKYGGIECAAGWWPIVTSLCANIQNYINWKNRHSAVVPQVTVAQIKEKFGGLRFYYSGGDEYISGLVTMAEAWTSHACEECGAPGTSRDGGWIKTLCNTHHNLRESRKQSGV
jgi:hypothetical protein